MKRHRRKRMEYCTKPATIVDWLIILLAIYIVSEWNFFVFDLKESEDSLMGDEALAVKRQV